MKYEVPARPKPNTAEQTEVPFQLRTLLGPYFRSGPRADRPK